MMTYGNGLRIDSRTREKNISLFLTAFSCIGAQTEVKWWRGSNLLADSGDPGVQSPERITLYSNGSLRVLHVQREDSGKYMCQASRPSPWGSVTQVHEIEVMCEYRVLCWLYTAMCAPRDKRLSLYRDGVSQREICLYAKFLGALKRIREFNRTSISFLPVLIYKLALPFNVCFRNPTSVSESVSMCT